MDRRNLVGNFEYWIYYLFYDDDPLLGYIGQSVTDPFKRRNSHIIEAINQQRTDKHKWIITHIDDDLQIMIAENAHKPNIASVDVREQFWIDYLRWEGITLLNIKTASTWPGKCIKHPIIHYSQRYHSSNHSRLERECLGDPIKYPASEIY